ncbi:polysaccharide deacetylase [Rhizobium sp. TRM96647]|uniref:polysaccharide deacetylase n=1 Tax=unclassified Rhizobium TaxID=2613769 RepID=UPI0021E8745D|nr:MULTISPECIES: polysaccharide deacetylase [unclassified Rhizobium]MCV3738127.1 polysaccharide deacetylase [Rhizobium sp. TRM96647]MCV3759814.1 polysaccharide deacetylase [Rhizobium sp. TRM96650]
MFRSSFSAVLAISLAGFPALAQSPQDPADKAPAQLVVVSFDGAHDNRLWTQSREMARRTGAHFTYFLSCTFLMTKENRKSYQAPHHPRGKSNVGFAPDNKDVVTRLEHIWQARAEGHDIGSHACGHFDGAKWSTEEWKQEFDFFRNTLRDAWQNAGVPEREPVEWRNFAEKDIAGFRAPYLSSGPALTQALRDFGFRYDASQVSKGPVLPNESDGFVHFSLPLIPEGPSARPVIGMDYNLFVRHSRGIEDKKNSATFEERTLSAFRAAFDEQYAGDRIPLQLGFHFVAMNGGAYWRALDRFLTEVCSKPGVACVSQREAMDILAERTKAARAASETL